MLGMSEFQVMRYAALTHPTRAQLKLQPLEDFGMRKMNAYRNLFVNLRNVGVKSIQAYTSVRISPIS